MSARPSAKGASARAPATANDGSPSLALTSIHPLKCLPSLLPRTSSPNDSSSLRDTQAEVAQQTAVWTAVQSDLSLLLRMPLSEFLSHLLYNKSVHRLFENALAQLPTVWAQLTQRDIIQRWWRTEGDDEEESDEKQDKKEAAPVQKSAPATKEQLLLLRGVAKKILLVYVRLCATELQAANNDSKSSSSS